MTTVMEEYASVEKDLWKPYELGSIGVFVYRDGGEDGMLTNECSAGFVDVVFQRQRAIFWERV